MMQEEANIPTRKEAAKIIAAVAIHGAKAGIEKVNPSPFRGRSLKRFAKASFAGKWGQVNGVLAGTSPLELQKGLKNGEFSLRLGLFDYPTLALAGAAALLTAPLWLLSLGLGVATLRHGAAKKSDKGLRVRTMATLGTAGVAALPAIAVLLAMRAVSTIVTVALTPFIVLAHLATRCLSSLPKKQEKAQSRVEQKQHKKPACRASKRKMEQHRGFHPQRDGRRGAAPVDTDLSVSAPQTRKRRTPSLTHLHVD